MNWFSYSYLDCCFLSLLVKEACIFIVSIICLEVVSFLVVTWVLVHQCYFTGIFFPHVEYVSHMYGNIELHHLLPVLYNFHSCALADCISLT